MKILLACSGLVAAARAVAVRGVNLGGWLVLERYIRPSIMEVGFGPDVFPDDVEGQGYPVDQWTYATLSNSLGGKNATRERLTPHWDTWVTEDDIVTLRRAGITHVRVPIGHWILGDIADDEPYVDGEWWYLARAARWCQAHGMQIWLDLHTAPGSQNGFDNSGHLMPVVQDPITHRVISGTPPQWSLHPENVARTKRILQAIIDEVAADDALRATVTGFGPLNEPFAFTKPSVLKEYYDAALAIIRGGLGDEVTVYIGDMFNSTVFNNYWREPADGAYVDAENVLLDSHIYHCFFPAWRRYTGWMHIHSVCSERDEGRPRPPGTQIHDIDNIAQCCNAPPGDPGGAPNLGRLVGEWTLAFDQAPSPELEGYTAEHPHRNAGRHMSDAKRTFLRDFAEAQMVTCVSSLSLVARRASRRARRLPLSPSLSRGRVSESRASPSRHSSSSSSSGTSARRRSRASRAGSSGTSRWSSTRTSSGRTCTACAAAGSRRSTPRSPPRSSSARASRSATARRTTRRSSTSIRTGRAPTRTPRPCRTAATPRPPRPRGRPRPRARAARPSPSRSSRAARSSSPR